MEPKTSDNMYINEHLLAAHITMFKNYNSAIVQDVHIHELYEQALQAYCTALETNEGNKRSAEVQTTFKNLIRQASATQPNDHDVEELYCMIQEMCKRCINMYARGSCYDYNEITNITFERLQKYRKSFDLTKISEVSGSRVNSFAYITQMIKNVIFAEHARVKTQKLTAEKFEYQDNFYEEDVAFDFQDRTIEDTIVSELSQCTEYCNDLQELVYEVKNNLELDIRDIIRCIVDYNLRIDLETSINSNKIKRLTFC